MINVASIADSQIEDQLFGHLKTEKKAPPPFTEAGLITCNFPLLMAS
jgi:hypothetical protein